MAETTTAKFAWTKPDPGASANTWGTTLNATTDKIDAQVYANQQAGVPIGTIIIWAGPNAKGPTNWILCAGQSVSTTTYAALFAVVGYIYGGSGANFNLPNLLSKFPMGAANGEAPGVTGGASTVTLDATMIPAHTHTASQSAHTHPGSYQDAHSHVITTGQHAHVVATGGHNHTISTGSHAHSGVVVPGGTFSLGQPGWTTQPGNTSTVGDLGGSTSFAGNLGGNTDTVGNLGGSADARQPAVHIDTQQPAVTVNANTGGGAAHPNIPPYLQLNFFIKYQ